jgi:hypothetical protein
VREFGAQDVKFGHGVACSYGTRATCSRPRTRMAAAF